MAFGFSMTNFHFRWECFVEIIAGCDKVRAVQNSFAPTIPCFAKKLVSSPAKLFIACTTGVLLCLRTELLHHYFHSTYHPFLREILFITVATCLLLCILGKAPYHCCAFHSQQLWQKVLTIPDLQMCRRRCPVYRLSRLYVNIIALMCTYRLSN